MFCIFIPITRPCMLYIYIIYKYFIKEKINYLIISLKRLALQSILERKLVNIYKGK